MRKRNEKNDMEKHFHVALWIDHHEARIFSFNVTKSDKLVVHPAHPVRHIHHKANTIGSGHAGEDKSFFAEVSKSVEQAGSVLIAGPANARLELMKFLKAEHPEIAAKVVGVERMDQCSDGEFLFFAKKFFAKSDRMST